MRELGFKSWVQVVLCLSTPLFAVSFAVEIHRQTIRACHSESPRPRLHDVSPSLFLPVHLSEAQLDVQSGKAVRYLQLPKPTPATNVFKRNEPEKSAALCAASCSPLCCLFVRPPANHNSSLQPNLNCEVPLRKTQCRSQGMPASAIAWRRTEGSPHRCDCCHAVSTAAASAAAMSSSTVWSPEMSRMLSSSSPRSPAQSTSQGKSLSAQPGANTR